MDQPQGGLFLHIKALAGQSAIYGGGRLVSRLSRFLLLPVFYGYLATEQNGMRAMAQVAVVLLSTLVASGFATAVFRHYLDQEREKKGVVISSGLAFVVVLSGLLALIVVFLMPTISQVLFGDKRHLHFVTLIYLTACFTACNNILLSVLRARQQAKLFVALTLSDFFLAVALNTIFIIGLKRGVEGALEANFLACSVLTIMLVLAVREITFALDWSLLGKMLKFGLPLVPSGLAMWVLNLSDNFFLKHFRDLGEVGVYRLTCTLGLLPTFLLQGPFRLAWVPYLFSVRERPEAKRLCSRALTYYLAIAALLWVGLVALAKPVITIMAKPEYHEAHRFVWLIALASLFYGIYYVVDVGVLLTGKTIIYPFISGAGGVITLLAGFTLVRFYGMAGAALGRALSFAGMLAAMWIASARLYPVSYEWRRILKVVVAAGIAAIVLKFIPELNPYLELLVGAAVLLIYVLALFVSGYFTAAEKLRAKKLAATLLRRISGKVEKC